MADKNTLSQMLEHLVNDDQQKAEELFHEYVVTRSREIYQDLIESEISEEDDEDEDEENKEVDEASEASQEDEDLDEVFDEIAAEADDEEDEGGPDMTGDLEGEIDAGGDMDDMGGDDLSDESEEDLFQDLDSIVDELQARFDELKGDEGSDDMGDMGDMGDEMKDDMDLETVREYVEKVPVGHGAEKKGTAEKSDSTKSLIDNMKNDMGGTTANILSGRNGADAGSVGAAGGKVKGSALSDTSAKEDNAGNINTPGAKNGNAFNKKEPGHGAEKKGSAESADNKQSLFRGRR
jgi:hypothetical protein